MIKVSILNFGLIIFLIITLFSCKNKEPFPPKDLRKLTDAEQISFAKDRILINDGKPQIYGTQITEDQETGELMIYDLSDSETIDERRAKVGLEPLSVYVKHWDIEFNVKQR